MKNEDSILGKRKYDEAFDLYYSSPIISERDETILDFEKRENIVLDLEDSIYFEQNPTELFIFPIINSDSQSAGENTSQQSGKSTIKRSPKSTNLLKK